jgi:polyhydroxyalkanoate synthesis repressor PhaR
MAIDPVLIKRYDRRRLYNTVTARYVTLDDLADMTLDGQRFVVKDARTGEDITRELLDALH